MYRPYTIGAIFIVFILCVHCDKAANYNEIKEIFVPSAPQNLSVRTVLSTEIHLSWVPPSTHTLKTLRYEEPLEPPLVLPKSQEQNDGPINEIPLNDVTDPDPIRYDVKPNFKDQYPSSIMNDSFRKKRDMRSHRHRKRRQDITDAKHHEKTPDDVDSEYEPLIEVVKRSGPVFHEASYITYYVLYYEQGVPRYDTSTIFGVQTSADVKKKFVFPSDLGMEDKATTNLTLLNNSKNSKVVGFKLKNLIPFTPYKIWVRAFYNFSLGGVSSSDLIDRLGPKSEALYALTDVKPPSAPIVLNLTCDHNRGENVPSLGNLYLQWRQPLEYNNSLDQYVVTLRKIPEQAPRTRLTMPTNKSDIETTITINAELYNTTRYEVKIYAVTLSVAVPNLLVNGTESQPEEVSSEWCSVVANAILPETVKADWHSTALPAILLILLLLAMAVAVSYWRCRSRLSKCISAMWGYLDPDKRGEGARPQNKKPVASCNLAAPCAATPPAPASPPLRPPRMAARAHPALPAPRFATHVTRLHADGDIGFSKEYEIIVAKSAALGHTSQYSHRPENRLKNRYLNITAYDHSRVCVSAGARCGAAGCVGAAGARAPSCDYVNANYIDGMLPRLSAARAARLRRRTRRQPSIKPPKPPPNLAEGIESAFLNIEFSGIVESDDPGDSDSDRSDDDDTDLDDVYVDIEGEKTRVKLEWLVWKRRYIATQGPTPATLPSFWRMIWQHRVHTIVMITNLVERGRRKCDMYWPGGDGGSSATFGSICVTLLHEDVRAAFTVRTMRVRREDAAGGDPSTPSEARTIVQFHYTVWPDHGTPRHPLAVLPFVRAAGSGAAPVLVHCSAGVGRTGTYIVLDAQLNQLQLTGTLSPLGYLCRARTQRNHLVQTEEQYVFVHDALLQHARAGDTDVEFTKARQYLVKLLEPITEEELAVLDLNPVKHKSVNDLVNGIEETSSMKSSQVFESEKEMENGSVSMKTDDLNSELSKSVKDVNEDEARDEAREEARDQVNGEESEGVYDLAPRATDTYSKKMQAFNNMSEQEKEEIRRANRAENYAILERMRSLSNRPQIPPPVNLLEKQFMLITNSCVEPATCARAAHNVDKNRPGGTLPSDCARVMLIPKPAVEGSEYVNASWVCGRRRLREYAVTPHPHTAAAAPALWRLLWDHTAQLVLLHDCEVFWPTEEEPEMYIANFKASFVSKETYVAHRKSERKSPSETPTEPEVNGYSRQESECADDERLIPENGSPNIDPEPAYRFDRTELRLERLSTGNRDLSARKSIANGDLFSSLCEKRNGTKSPRSPSKMSLKNFKLSSPTKMKFSDWGKAGSPPDVAPPPPPVAPSLSVEDEIELRRPCYYFEKTSNTENIPSDRIIDVYNVSVHSLQDDYQLSVKFIKCDGWLEGNTTEYTVGKPDENEFIRAVKQATSESEKQEAIDRLIEPYKDSFALIEYVAGTQMEYKNGPVVVVDKYGGAKAMTFCTLSAACGGARNLSVPDPSAAYRLPGDDTASVYCWAALSAHARCVDTAADAGVRAEVHTHASLLAAYCALAGYGGLLELQNNRLSSSSSSIQPDSR